MYAPPRLINRYSFTILLLCILYASTAAPQATPKYVNNQTASGDRPFASFLSADIDQVQLNNGALDVRLGMYDLKARGLNLNRSWHYTNKIWMVPQSSRLIRNCVECRPISDAGIECSKRFTREREVRSEALRFNLGKRIEAELEATCVSHSSLHLAD